MISADNVEAIGRAPFAPHRDATRRQADAPLTVPEGRPRGPVLRECSLGKAEAECFRDSE